MRRYAAWLMIAALPLAGCGGRVDEDAGQMVLRVGNGGEVQDLDPHLVSGVIEHRVLTTLFEGLCDLDPVTMTPEPGVAETWDVSDDGLTYTFHLRPDAKWSNGDPVTAHDFAYAWQRMLSPALAAEYAYFLHPLKNGKAFNEGVITDFSEVGVEAVDDRTLVATLEQPTPYFLSMQIHMAWFPVHRATIEAFGAMDERGTRWTRQENHVGNGPFELAEWSPNQVLRVERNPYYWDAANVKLDGIRFYPIDDELTEERKFNAGGLHLTSTVPLHRVKVYQEEHPEVIHLDPYLAVEFYRLNTTKPPFDDVRVRRAFAMALDREELTENVLTAGQKPAHHLTPPDTAGYTARASIPTDVEAARALLAEAGYPNGEGLPPVEILYNTADAHRLVAETVQAQWKRNLGADVKLLNQDWKVYLDTMNSLDYQVARSGWTGDVVDPVNFLECFLSGSGNNRTGYSNPAYDNLVQRAYAEPGKAARYELLQQAEAILMEDVVIAPVFFATRRYLLAPEVKDCPGNLLGYVRWKRISLGPGAG